MIFDVNFMLDVIQLFMLSFVIGFIVASQR